MDVKNLPYDQFEEAILEVNRIKATEIFRSVYENERDFKLLETLAEETLRRIGDGWEQGDISLSQVYMAGIISEELIDNYLPLLNYKRIENPKMAIGVLLDHHSLGKRIVYSILRAAGYEILDFGQGLTPDQMVKKSIEEKIEILLISTLMLNSALHIKKVKEIFDKEKYSIKIIAGGAPFRFDKDLWVRVGADADGKMASDVLETIESIFQKEAV